MSKKDILEWFSVNSESLGATTILGIMCIGLLIALIIFVTYRVAYNGVAYNAKFNVGNVVLLLIAAVVMLMISSNIAISLGMVGALSIVRFRTAIKDPQDTVYIFWSIVEGLCVGAQIFKLAIISTLVIAIVLVMASLYTRAKKQFLIIIRGKNVSLEEINTILNAHYSKIRVRTANYGDDRCELIYEVVSKNELDEAVINDIRNVKDVHSVNWLLEMGEHVG